MTNENGAATPPEDPSLGDPYMPIPFKPDSIAVSSPFVARVESASPDERRGVYLGASISIEGCLAVDASGKPIEGRRGHIEIVPAFMPDSNELLLQFQVFEGARPERAIDKMTEVDIGIVLLIEPPAAHIEQVPPDAKSDGT